MIRVAHITTIDLSLRFLMLNQLRAIRDAGFDVSGISCAGPHVAAVEAAGIHHHAVRFTRKIDAAEDARAFADLVGVLRRERFDIVHVHTPKPALYGQIAARMLGVPIVVNTLHGLPFRDHTPWIKRRPLLALEAVCAKMSDRILSQNQDDIDTLVGEGVAPASLYRYLGNGIDVERFDRRRIREEDLDRLRSGWGIARGAPVVGFVGRLVAEKGILELARAMERVAKEVPGVRLLLIGPTDGEKSDALSPQDPRFDAIRPFSVFTGLRQDMPEMFALMDVFVLPSHREGFPRSPMEAASMGLPVIVTDVSGCRQTVNDGETGYLFPLGEHATLAERLLRLLKSPEDRAKKGAAGRRLAEDAFDERHVFRIVIDTYRELLATRGVRRSRG